MIWEIYIRKLYLLYMEGTHLEDVGVSCTHVSEVPAGPPWFITARIRLRVRSGLRGWGGGLEYNRELFPEKRTLVKQGN